MPNTEKVRAVAEIAEQFTSSSAALITAYRGLTVKQVTELRRSLGTDASYAIVKNTLTKRAAADAGLTIDDSLLVGPTAIAFVSGDPVVAAKGLRDFARTNPLLVIKGGVFEGRQLSAAEIGRIADLESREVLLAKLAGALKALPTRAAGLFQAPLSQFARLAKALEEKKPAAEAATEAPAAEADAEAPTAASVAEAATETPAAEASAEAATETPAAEASAEAATETPAAEAVAEAANGAPAEPAE